MGSLVLGCGSRLRPARPLRLTVFRASASPAVTAARRGDVSVRLVVRVALRAVRLRSLVRTLLRAVLLGPLPRASLLADATSPVAVLVDERVLAVERVPHEAGVLQHVPRRGGFAS